MPSLTIPEDGPSSSPLVDRAGSESPEAPPYSPITPVLAEASLPAPPGHAPIVPPRLMEAPPPPVPISESINPDAIALRAALSVLQLQRLRSMQDLQTLERQKNEAAADPEQFARNLASGIIRSAKPQGLLGAAENEPLSETTEETDDSATESDKERNSSPALNFGLIPGPQNVVRCPPINWTKYHIVGEALDKLHEGQRLRPSSTPQQQTDQPAQAPVHLIAAPYSPWKDKLPEPSTRTRADSKKG